MATMMLVRPAPRMVRTSSASNRPGNASSTSIRHMIVKLSQRVE